MKIKIRILLLGLIMIIVFSYDVSVLAESNFTTKPAKCNRKISSSASIDFKIIIPLTNNVPPTSNDSSKGTLANADGTLTYGVITAVP